MKKTVADRIVDVEAKVLRAKMRLDRASKKQYALLGWGESEKVERAQRAVIAATQHLMSAEAFLKRLQGLKR